MTDNNKLVTPETFEETADRFLQGKKIFGGLEETGFVFQGNVRLLVGYKDTERSWILGSMIKRTTIVNQEEPELETQENTEILCDFYRLEGNIDFTTLNPDEFTRHGLSGYKNVEYIDTGYLNGHPSKTIAGIVDEIFKWYATEQQPKDDDMEGQHG